MPHSDRHKQQRGKNYLMLAVLLAVITGLFVLTRMKFG